MGSALVGAALVAADSEVADAEPADDSSFSEPEPHPESPIPSATAAMAATPARMAIVMSLLSVGQWSTRSVVTKAGSPRSISIRAGGAGKHAADPADDAADADDAARA